MYHKALLEKLGHNVQVYSLGAHARYLKHYFSPPPPAHEVRLRRYLMNAWQNLAVAPVERAIRRRQIKIFHEIIASIKETEWRGTLAAKALLSMMLKYQIKQADLIQCSFPPLLFYAIKMLMNTYNLDKPIILNMGHRFNIWVKGQAVNELLKTEIIALHKDSRNIVGALHEYDYQYAKHYLGINVQKTYLHAFHIPLKKHLPTKKNTILLGPAHARNLYGLSKSVADFNEEYRAWCRHRGIVPQYNFDYIKAIHPEYEIDQLRQYAGVVIFPYSAYSISMIELYELNLPFFAPSVDLIIKHNMAVDRALFPLYCSKEQYETMENDADALDSPNSMHPEAQRKWLQYAYCNCKENTLFFNSKEHLFEQVSQLPNYRGDVSSRMYEENCRGRENNLQLWQGLLEKI